MILGYIKDWNRRRTFYRVVDIWASADGSLGVFHPLVMSLTDTGNVHKERLEAILTFWISAWMALLDKGTSHQDNSNEEFILALYSEILPTISVYLEDIASILENLDDTDSDVNELLGELLSHNEQLRKSLYLVENSLDEGAAILNLAVPGYRYSRKAASRFANHSMSKVLYVLRRSKDSHEEPPKWLMRD